MRRTARLPLPLLLAAMLIAGCATPAPMPTAPPVPSEAPVFASDEEALAAAEEAYGRYLETVALVLADGGSGPERLRPFLTDDLFTQELVGYEDFATRGWRAVGQHSFDLTLQDFDPGTGDVTAYVCDDRSQLDIVDSHGASVVAPDRPDLAASEVGFVWRGALIIASQTAWNGGGVC